MTERVSVRGLMIALWVGIKYGALIPFYVLGGFAHGINRWLTDRENEAYDRLHRLRRFAPPDSEEKTRG